MHCDFSDIQKLGHWSHERSLTRGVTSYDKQKAAGACRGAELVLLKTINVTGVLSKWENSDQVQIKRSLKQLVEPELEENKGLRVIDVIRDPRAVYASWAT